ncbi:MAG: PilW family protein [Pseudomonadota bacterium]
MKTYPSTLANRHNAGFSLVDIMVGMVLSLVGTVIIFQVFAVSEGIKRTTTGGGDAQQNGAMTLFTIERKLKMAGYGLSSNDAAAGLRIPVQINFGASSSNPDALQFTSRPTWDYGPFIPNAAVSMVLPAPTIETFSVNNNAQFISDLNGTYSDGIVLMKAQYGTDSDGNGTISSGEWSFAAPTDPMQVLAVRVAIVARSAQPEKPSAGATVCNTTTVAPTWAGGTLDLSGNLGLGAGDDWKCYRYKTFEVTAPLRNVLWTK